MPDEKSLWSAATRAQSVASMYAYFDVDERTVLCV
jgi:hypothetical protein